MTNLSSTHKADIHKFMRCTYSKEATEKLVIKNPDKKGIIVGETLGGKAWLIRWDGNRTKSMLHKDFIVAALNL